MLGCCYGWAGTLTNYAHACAVDVADELGTSRCPSGYLLPPGDEARARRPLSVAVRRFWLFESDIVVMARCLLQARPYRSSQVDDAERLFKDAMAVFPESGEWMGAAWAALRYMAHNE